MESRQNKFSFGKINSKNLIFEVLSYSYYLSDASGFFFQASKQARKLLIENYFTILNTLIPEASMLKKFPNLIVKDRQPPTIPRFAVYNLDLN